MAESPRRPGPPVNYPCVACRKPKARWLGAKCIDCYKNNIKQSQSKDQAKSQALAQMRADEARNARSLVQRRGSWVNDPIPVDKPLDNRVTIPGPPQGGPPRESSDNYLPREREDIAALTRQHKQIKLRPGQVTGYNPNGRRP